MCNKILNAEIKGDKYFVDEVETQLREKPLRGSQTQDIHYSEDKASYKAIAFTYPWCSGRTLNSNVLSNTNASQPCLLPEGVFNEILYLRANPLDRLQISAAIAHTIMASERQLSSIISQYNSLSTNGI